MFDQLFKFKFMCLRSAKRYAARIFHFFVISLGRVEVPSPKIVKNLPGTYENLPC